MNPTPLEVCKLDPQQLPRQSLAFAYPHCDGYRALIVDVGTWGVHSLVEAGSRDELVDVLARKHDTAAGILFMAGPGPMSDIVVNVGPRPGGGGGPRGWPNPLLLSIVEAVSRVAKY